MNKGIKPPSVSHPVLRQFFEIVAASGVTWKQLAGGSGISRVAIWEWHRRSPTLLNFEAALGVLGYEIMIVPKDEQ